MNSTEETQVEKEQRNSAGLIVVASGSVLGCFTVLEGLVKGWEYWMLPILLFGAVLMWVAHIRQIWSYESRERFYVIYIMAAALFYGVHETGMVSVVILMAVLLAIAAQLDTPRLLDYVFVEYLVLTACQIYFQVRAGALDGGAGSVFANVDTYGYLLAALIVYLLSRNVVVKHREYRKRNLRIREDQEKTNQSMEDFLANISHEFRTPINAVTGMSSLMMKEEANDKITAIYDAGLRLSAQVSDILDYTEITSGRVVLVEEKYQISSFVNDIIQNIYRPTAKRIPDLVIDMDANVPQVMSGDVQRLRKVLLHLLSNAMKFNPGGGIYLHISAIPRDYGVNLNMEVTDTGKGMSREEISEVSKGLYQTDQGRDRRAGGIGLGLTIVYGFVHEMEGFVRMESEAGRGTTVRLSIPQATVDDAPCLCVDRTVKRYVIFYIKPEKFQIPRVRDFYQDMVKNLAVGLDVPMRSVISLRDLKKLCETMDVTHIFIEQEEYEEDRAYFHEMSEKLCVAVTVERGFVADRDGKVVYLPKPLHGFRVADLLNAGEEYDRIDISGIEKKPTFQGVRALIVDDETMNLVVATGLFRDYQMITETAGSGREALDMYSREDYDIIFMDHMMPEMDGVEAMRKLRELGKDTGREPVIVALTANAVSGARKMFLSEGFDGFLAKPIEIGEFESVMKQVLPPTMVQYTEGERE